MSLKKYNKRNISTRRKRVNPLPIYLLSGVVLVLVFVVLSLTVLFRLDNFDIPEEYRYTRAEIEDATGLSGGENLIRLNSKALEKRLLARLPYFETVKVEKKLPSTVRITYTVAEEYAYIQVGANVCIVNREGRVLSENGAVSEDLVALSGVNFSKLPLSANSLNGERTYAGFDDERTREAFSQLIDALEKYNITGVTRIDIPNYLDIKFVTDERVRVELGTMVDLDYKLKYVRGLIDSDNIPEEEYVILNVQNVERGASVRSGAVNGVTYEDVINFG